MQHLSMEDAGKTVDFGFETGDFESGVHIRRRQLG